MKIDKDKYLHFNVYSKDHPPMPWALIFARHTHAAGFPLQDNRFAHNEADYWAIEAEIILRSYEEHPRWGDRLIFKHDHFHLWPFAFAPAWERSEMP